MAKVYYLNVLPAEKAVSPEPLPVATSRAKRAFDIVVAASALLLFLPLLLLIAIVVRMESSGPALFRQRRTGLNGQVFTIYKFRTMRVVEDHGAVRQATKDDVRVTPFGGLLRKCSLDELPQILNVLKGDMSIVGPRPHAVAHDKHYGALIPTYVRRYRARPGLTGLAQVSGLRGEIKILSGMSRRIDADNEYIDSWSFGRDLWIVLRTVPLLLIDPQAY